MPVHTLRTIQDFLAQKRFAIAGVSRDPKDFSRYLLRELQARGYDIVPVNPNATEIDGRRCFSAVSAVEPAVEAALVLTNPQQTEPVVEDCIRAGVKSIWLRNAGPASAPAVDLCRTRGVNVVAGECPFMYLPQTQWFHRIHRGLRKVSGTFPLPG